jgi:hypothetical protein
MKKQKEPNALPISFFFYVFFNGSSDHKLHYLVIHPARVSPTESIKPLVR